MAMPAKVHDYRIYGIRFRSAWSLSYPEIEGDGPIDIELRRASSSLQQSYGLTDEMLSRSPCIELNDASIYLHWPNLMEFVIAADGRQIWGNPLISDPTDTLQALLFG